MPVRSKQGERRRVNSRRKRGKHGFWTVFRRVLYAGVLLIGLLLLALWFGRHKIANELIDEALAALSSRASRLGISMSEVEAGPVVIPSPWEARIPNFRTEFDLGDPNRNQVRSSFTAKQARASLAGVFPPKARLYLDRFSLRFHPEDIPASFPFEGFEDANFMSSPLPASDPAAAMRVAVAHLKELFEDNEVAADFDLNGTVELKLGPEGGAKARLYTEPLPNGSRRLRFNKEDLTAIAAVSGLDVAEAELDIISLYPVRAPVIFVISSEAKRGAATRRAKDRKFPEDAFRHITWSYQLTRAFGPDFAKQVTDAHETLPNNTPEERAMDYHNNALARRLAEKEISPAALEQIVRTDPRVIRDPNEVNGRSELLR